MAEPQTTVAVPPRVVARPIRVMIVDDAVVVRGLLSRWFAEAGGIEVVSTHRTGLEAVNAIDRVKPDVVLLDIEMPDMDGVTALPLLLKKCPGTTIIVVSTLTTRNAEISLRCLSLGAIDYVAKPSTNRDVTFSTDFRREITAKVIALGKISTPEQRASRPSPLSASLLRAGILQTAKAKEPVSQASSSVLENPNANASIQLRPLAKVVPRILVIGASTGGPNAVTELLRACRPAIKQLPVIIAQHMPTMFTAMFADHLRRQLTIDASEAHHGEMVEAGRIYVAPGGKHLHLKRCPAGVRAVVDDAPPVNFCKPSVDVTLLSANQVYGNGVLAVMLTGMGSDGLRGASDLIERGGNLLAQDEASSVVWGMPGAVAKRGLCAAVEPIERLARVINLLSGAERP
jgi:two-component system, chemotaxis family, protein-glutamate methylesterase/glutaminase